MTSGIPPPPHVFIFQVNLSGPPSESFQSFQRFPPFFSPKSKWSLLKSSAPAPHLQAINNDRFLTKVKLRLWRRLGRRLSISPLLLFFTGWLYHFKDFSYLFGAKFIGRKFYRWRHDNWPIGQWVIFHAAPDTAYVNQFFPSEFIIWFKFIVVSRGDLLGKPANNEVENNGAVVNAGSSLTVHNPLFFVHNSKLKIFMQCFCWSVSSKW